MTDLDEFLSSVKVGTEDECWIWQGAKITDGYGRVLGGSGDKLAHRRSYELHTGPIAAGMCVMHRCDVTSCVNPKHLSLGTRGDNNRDRAAKGRSSVGDAHYSRVAPTRLSRGDEHYSRQKPERLARGSGHGNSKLTEEQVREIRAAKELGDCAYDLAARYGISRTNVYDIVRRSTWRHVS